MPEKDSDTFTTAPLRDRRTRPPGILPRHTQTWVLGGITLLMAVIMAVSGINRPKDRKSSLPPASAAVVDPNQARIQDYGKHIEAQTRKLQLEQDQLEQAKRALRLAQNIPPGAAPPGSYQGYPPGASYTQASPAYGNTERNAAQNTFRAEKKKREYESMFASNIVMTHRPQGAPQKARQTMTRAQEQNEPVEQGAQGVKRTDLEASDPNVKKYRLFEGTVIETVLINRLDGYFSGPVNCMVTTHVYSHDGQRLVIPQGSRVLGEVKRVDTFGQQRLSVVFHRLLMPNGYSVSLDQFQGLNQIGETGLRDQVNHHYLQVFGVSLAIGAIAGLAQVNTSYGFGVTADDAMRQGAATSLSQSALHILDRYLNVLPTFTIREGHRVKVYLSQDLLLPAYNDNSKRSEL